MCVYGNQDLFRLLGRDPMTSPLSKLERSLFMKAIEKHKQAEFGAKKDEILETVSDAMTPRREE